MAPRPIPIAYREVLVTALFAVNKYSYDRVKALMPRFQAAQLLDPERVLSLGIGPLTVAVYEAGYDRGLLTSRFAERLAGLMASLRGGDLDDLPALIQSGDESATITRLCTVPGIGPVVARTIWKALRTLDDEQRLAT